MNPNSVRSEGSTYSVGTGSRWLALAVLCLGVVMIILDTTIVNVALPSIREALGFDETTLVWVVNAYMLTFGGFLLLSGRLGDLYGHRRIFLGGWRCSPWLRWRADSLIRRRCWSRRAPSASR